MVQTPLQAPVYRKTNSNKEIIVRNIDSGETKVLHEVVDIHDKAFKGFFLTFMGKGFLYQMYRSFSEDKNSGLMIAEEDGKTVGFLAYSSNLSGLYKNMIKKRLFAFGLFAFLAFLRRPKSFMHIIRAFLKPSESKREEPYVELSSIGVLPDEKSSGIGSAMIDCFKGTIDFSKYEYITLETDAVNNEAANSFYRRNGFVLYRRFTTREGREMNEYRFSVA